MTINHNLFQRTELLLGKEFLECAAEKNVIIFGLGGVGSWCAETLVRSGIGRMTIVDSDRVSESNINRQLIATTKTVGRAKTEVMRERLLEINPNAAITPLEKIYCPETSESFGLENYDFIIDAIDSLSNKVHLIQQATQTQATFFSSMGAALKVDPSHIQVAEFWKVKGCPLAAALRSRLKKAGGVSKKFLCVYSDEIVEYKPKNTVDERKEEMIASREIQNTWDSRKARINGTTSYIPAMFGMTLTSLVVREILNEIEKKNI